MWINETTFTNEKKTVAKSSGYFYWWRWCDNVMANEKNLVSLKKRTTIEQREIAKKGGIASGVARRRKKTLKELTQMFMQMRPAKESDVKKLIAFGLNEEEITNQAYMMYKIYEAATTKGNMRAAEFLREMLGENPYNEIKKAELELKKQEFELKKQLALEGKNMSNMAIPVVLVDDVKV